MKIRTGSIALVLAVVLVLSISLPAIGADRMTYEEYQAQLKVFQDQEFRAKQAIDAERQKIEELKQRIKEVIDNIDAVWKRIFTNLEIDREVYDRFLEEIATLETRVRGLERLSPNDLLDHASELDELGAKIEEMMTAQPAKISTARNRLSDLASRIDRLKRALPKPKHDMYTVIRGDYLWRISGKSQIYNDPWKWMRIYSYNRESINDPDLIYPDQRLTIPRQIGSDEHLVVRGEFLSKIAGYREVYGDPFKWTKIYQANKGNGFVQDPNLIYPEQILTIPQN